jgi:ABC-type multidrug transport system ATPase subunit
MFVPRPQRTGVDLTWDGLEYTVDVKGEPKTLLRGVSGTSRQGRVLAIMGPSGAGKTTLLNTISGRIKVSASHRLGGTAYLNETVFAAKHKKLISFVAQDDIAMGKDTAREALYFSSRLRSGSTPSEATAAVDVMLAKLGLADCADTLLGVPGLIKGVSGGEKKRVNIGCGLINNPMILMLDEPSTGLDSVSALRVGRLLSELARDDNRTVLCTIHTPSSELYAVFDDVLLLAKGRVAYHGPRDEAPAYFEALGHPVPHLTNPSEFFMTLLQSDGDVIGRITDAWLTHVSDPTVCGNLSQNRAPPIHAVAARDEFIDASVKKQHASAATEMALLTARSLRAMQRDPLSTFGRLFQTAFCALLFGAFYWRLERTDAGVGDLMGLVFLMTGSLAFFNVMFAVTVFAPERNVFLEEMMSESYSPVFYYFSKMLADFPILVALPLVGVSITYYMAGLADDTATFLLTALVCLTTAYAADAYGMLTATLFPSIEVAMALATLMLLPFFIVAGIFANTKRLDPYWVWLNYLSFVRWSFKALLTLQMDNIGPLCAGGGQCRFNTGDDVLLFAGFDDDDDKWDYSCVAMAVLMVAFRVFGVFVFWLQAYVRRSPLVFEGNLSRSRQDPTPEAV